MIKKLFNVFMVALTALSVLACKEENPTPKPPVPKVDIQLVSAADKTISFLLTGVNADVVSYYCTNDPQEGAKLQTPEYVFSLGTSAEYTQPLSVTLEELEPEKTYWIFAAAKGGALYSETDSIKVTTTAIPVHLVAGEPTKTSLSYTINVNDGETYQHAYLEGWYFNHQLAKAMEDEGSEFDLKVFIWNMLADYGSEGTGPQTVTWKNGDENVRRNQTVKLLGGQKYVLLFSYIDGETGWNGNPEAVEVTLPPYGNGEGDITFTDEVVTTDKIAVRMSFDESKVSYIYYDLYPTEQFKQKFGEDYGDDLKNFLYEYALGAGNTYTDSWGVDSGVSYTLAILGVTVDGDTFIKTKEYTTPVPQPEIKIDMAPYDSPAQNQYSYYTLKVQVSLKNFGDINTDVVFANLMPKSQWDATFNMYAEAVGVTTPEEMLVAAPDYLMYALQQMPIQENEAADLASKKSFTRIANDLEPGTEYFFGIMLMYNDQWHFAYATATLDEEPDTSNPEAEYLAFLGNWTVTGKSSKDYKTPLTYNLRIEQSVVNDSYKVYGWSAESFGETLPFIAKYNKATKKMDIYGNQFISDVETQDGNAQLRFMGVLQYAGQNYLSDYDKVIYSATVRDNGTQEILGMSPAFFEVDKKWYEVQTMAYGFTDSTGKILGGADEFDMVEFAISRDKK